MHYFIKFNSTFVFFYDLFMKTGIHIISVIKIKHYLFVTSLKELPPYLLLSLSFPCMTIDDVYNTYIYYIRLYEHDMSSNSRL